MIDEIQEPFKENAPQPDSLGTEEEKSHEGLDVNEANRFLAEDFQSGPNCLFELVYGESFRELGCIYFYSKDYHLCPLEILGVVLWETQYICQPDVAIGFALQSLRWGVRFEYCHKDVQVVI